ncbi:unnamed protein product, partial [marine sediment metagenome]
IFSDNIDTFKELAFHWESFFLQSNTHEGAIIVPREEEYILDNVKYMSEITISI